MSVQCIRLLGFVFFGIEIAIGIEIDAVDFLIFSNLVSSSAETAEHRGHAVEFILAVPAFHLVQRLADNQHILNRRALKRGATSDFEITPSVGFRGLAITFGDIQRYRLAGPKPLIPRRPMDSIQAVGFLVNPCDIAYGESVNSG